MLNEVFSSVLDSLKMLLETSAVDAFCKPESSCGTVTLPFRERLSRDFFSDLALVDLSAGLRESGLVGKERLKSVVNSWRTWLAATT